MLGTIKGLLTWRPPDLARQRPTMQPVDETVESAVDWVITLLFKVVREEGQDMRAGVVLEHCQNDGKARILAGGNLGSQAMSAEAFEASLDRLKNTPPKLLEGSAKGWQVRFVLMGNAVNIEIHHPASGAMADIGVRLSNGLTVNTSGSGCFSLREADPDK